MIPPKHLLLDVDGVIVTGRPSDGAFWAKDLEVDLGVPLDALRQAFFAVHWPAIVTGQADLIPVLQTVLQDIAPGVSAVDLVQYWFAQDARLDQAVIADMDRLRAQGVQITLATNQDRLRADFLMDELGLAQHADRICASARLGVAKPAPVFFTRLLATLNAAPTGAVFVDDTADNVRAAQDLGLRAVHWDGQRSLLDIWNEVTRA